MPGRLYLVRHGETKLNATDDASQDRERGWTDVPLTADGRDEARKAAEELKDKGVSVIWSSDLVRAKETAGIIGQILGITPKFSDKLRPWNLGKFAGESVKEIQPQLVDYAHNRPDEPVPDGESFNQFKDRAFAGLAEFARECANCTAAVITHHRVERLIEAWQANGQPADHSVNIRVFLQKGDPPGGVEELFLNRKNLGNGGTMAQDDDKKLSPAARMMRQRSGLEPADDAAVNTAGNPMGGMDQPPSGAVSAAGRDSAHTLAHGRAIAGAKALHAVGHITAAQRDRHIKKSSAAIKRKPFGAFAP